ncbi:WD repeat-containing protein 91 [Marchantia polymorpha subsp. ruderalis]
MNGCFPSLRCSANMESMQYAEAAVKEFLLFRGFTHTLHSFDAEVEADIGHGLQVDRIVDLLFTVYVPRFEADNMINLLAFLQKSFFPSAEERYHITLRKLEASLKKYYIVNAMQKARPDRVIHFFERHADSLLRSGDDWHSWFAIPYMQNPNVDPRFQVYFSKEWLDTLMVSFRNFLSEVFDNIRLPTLLKIHSERIKSRAMKQELEKLRNECVQLRAILKGKEEEISKFESEYESAKSQPSRDAQGENEVGPSPSQISSTASADKGNNLVPVTFVEDNHSNEDQESGSGANKLDTTSHETHSSHHSAFPQLESSELTTDAAKRWAKEEEVPQIIVESQETFSGHTSPITRCRFSTAGSNVASASVDGTVRIWTPDAAASTSRNATIYCGAEIMSLEWENKSDRLLLLGTAECGVKAWNVAAKRVVCDLNTDSAFPRILELKCSPTDALFLCVASSHPGNTSQGVENIAFGSLTVWNMRTWKLMNALPLGEDPPVVTSVCFNHNGKLVAAGATDGMIRLFDMNGCLPITGWPAHDGCAVSCVRFGHDHSSIFSLGSDGKVLEWSLHNQGQILQSHDASMFCSTDGSTLPRHEMALDSYGKSLLLSSNLRSAPMFKFNGTIQAYRTLDHNGGITSVDWHPLLPMFLTGSSDHSVRVTSIL